MNSMQGNGGEKTTPQPQLGEGLLHLQKEGEAEGGRGTEAVYNLKPLWARADAAEL